VQTLTRPELTVALAARQGLLVRRRGSAVDAIRELSPLQGQDSPAPFIALAARLEGFAQAELNAAIGAGQVVKTTLMRQTLHLVAHDEYPAYAQLARQAPLRAWRGRHPGLDETRVAAELRAWLREPRTNDEIRERAGGYEGVADDAWSPIVFARTLLPLVQLPPAGCWRERGRARFVADPRPLPDPVDAAALVARRYLAAFGPATRRDLAVWAGVPQRDFAAALERIGVVAHRDERGAGLLDLPGLALPPASTRLPVRLLARWDQALLAYADRERIIPAELADLRLTLSGDQTVTVDGRVAASWWLRRGREVAEVAVTPHVDLRRADLPRIRAEARRTARFCEPDIRRVGVAGV
jgi:hypothetical protein